MKKFGMFACLTVVLAAFGFHYYQLRWELQTSQFKNDLFESEHRILRDEINELARRPTYSQGVQDTIIRTTMDSSFQDGLRHAYENLPADATEVVESYHRATSHGWANVYYQQQLAEKKLKEETAKAFTAGRKDGYDAATADSKFAASHPDYFPREQLKKELEVKSPFVIDIKDE